MTFQSSLSNIQVEQEPIIRKVDILPDEVIVFLPDGSAAGSGILYNDLEVKSEKDQPNGYAGLDGSGKVNISVIPISLVGALNYQGAWNASTNTPNIQSSVGTKGYYYVVSIAGSTNIDGISSWEIGDWIVFNGLVWEKIDNTDLVISVNGKQGIVVLDKTDIGLGNVPNIDTSNASNITAGTLNNSRLSTDVVLLALSQVLENKTLGAGTKINIGSIANGDIYYGDASGNLVRLPIGSVGQVLKISGGVPSWQNEASGGGGAQYPRFSLTGSASSTTGLLSLTSDGGSTSNPSGKPSTTPFDSFTNGAIDPYQIFSAGTLTSIRITIAGAGVDAGSVGASPTLRLRVYKNNYNTRTQLGSDIDIVLSPTGVGTFNNASGNAFQTAISSALSIALSAGDLIGVEFVNQSGSSNGISSVRVLMVTMKIE